MYLVLYPLLRPQAFSVVFQKAVLKAEPDEALKQRVSNLIDSITSSVFQYTTRGLFECDKLTYIAQLAFQVGMEASFIFCMVCFENKLHRRITCSWDWWSCLDLIKWKGNVAPAEKTPFQSPSVFLCPQILMMNKDINPVELDFLLRYPVQPGVTSPVDFLSSHSWGGIKVLREDELAVCSKNVMTMGDSKFLRNAKAYHKITRVR